MKYWFDTEFIEKPCTIELISIGMVNERGQTYYAVSSEFNPDEACEWVKENVLQYIEAETPIEERKPKNQIASEILSFVGDDPFPKFYASYGAYDWVVFCWLFGKMVDLPRHFPMFVRDFRQILNRYGNPKIPLVSRNKHHALSDALDLKNAHEWLEDHTGHIISD